MFPTVMCAKTGVMSNLLLSGELREQRTFTQEITAKMLECAEKVKWEAANFTLKKISQQYKLYLSKGSCQIGTESTK